MDRLDPSRTDFDPARTTECNRDARRDGPVRRAGHNVEPRIPEIGLRLALGATRGMVLRSVLRETWTAVAAGSAVGLPLAIPLSRAVETLLHQVTPWDASVLIGAVACVLVVATATAAVPAWRASRVEPLEALRQE